MIQDPQTVIVSDKDLVNKILVEWDLPKAAKIYKVVNAVEPEGISLVTQVNKEKHKQRVRSISQNFQLPGLASIAGFLYRFGKSFEILCFSSSHIFLRAPLMPSIEAASLTRILSLISQWLGAPHDILHQRHERSDGQSMPRRWRLSET